MVMRLDFDNSTGTADLVRRGGSFLTGNELRTAVVLSLFSDARAQETDGYEPLEQRGWWGNAFPLVPGDEFGSRLWQCRRMKATRANVEKARRWAAEALKWMLEDGLATELAVEAEHQRPGTIAMAVRIRRPASQGHQWEAVWEGEVNFAV